MGFRVGAYATVWNVESVSGTMTKVRISTNRKNKDDEYEQDFGGYVAFVGTANANAAASLKERDRIKLGNCDVTNRYDKEKRTSYTNFTVFSFEKLEGSGKPDKAEDRAVDSGEVEPAEDGDGLPF